MTDLQLLDCFQPELVHLERVRYFPRQLLTPDDMTTDSEYFRQKLRRHNRFLHGWGVVCGLEVIADPIPDAPWRVQIGPGYALGPYGDEIYVAEAVYLDLAQCGVGAATNPCEPGVLQSPQAVEGGRLYVAIKYAECVSRPVRAMPAGCACEEVECEYSRIRDSFEIGCLPEAPATPDLPKLCDLVRERRIVPCLPCPTEPWVVLARVTLPASATSDLGIDNFVRPKLFMTALLQEQLIDCCCARVEPQPTDEADLQVTKEGIDDAGAGTITYTIIVTNLGSVPATNVVLKDTVTPPAGQAIETTDFSPPSMWKKPASPGGPFDAELGTLEPGHSVVLSFTVHGAPGDYVNTAEVTTATSESNLANNRYTIPTTLDKST